MARKNRSPEEIERRAKIRELLKSSDISSMDDIQNLFKETIAEFMENGLEAELDEELGYSKYNYRNEETENSRNGHSGKTLRTSFGEVDISILRDRKGEFEPQLLKKNQTSVSQDIEEKILSMYAKGIIHQLRNSSKYVSYEDLKALMTDLKAVCIQRRRLVHRRVVFSERWDKKYPKISASWRDNWPNLSTYFKYPQEVRRLIYTTNAIEGFNRQRRKVTKSKTVFPTDDSLFKMLYLATMDITKKWTGRRQDWSLIHAQLTVFFADRMPE